MAECLRGDHERGSLQGSAREANAEKTRSSQQQVDTYNSTIENYATQINDLSTQIRTAEQEVNHKPFRTDRDIRQATGTDS